MPIRTSIKKDEKQLLVGNVLLDTDNIFIIGSEAIFAKDAPHTQGTGDSAFWMYNKAADIVGISPKERPTNEHDWHVLLRKRSISSDFFITNALHDFGEKEEEFDFGQLVQYIDPDLKAFLKNAISYNLIDTIFTTAVDRTLEYALKEICEQHGKVLCIYNFKINTALTEYNQRKKDGNISLVYLFGAMDYKVGETSIEFVYSEDDAMKTITDYLRIREDNKKNIFENIFYKNRIIAIGCRFEDWKFRFFWYSIRGDIDKLANGTIAYSCEKPEEDPLYNYLKRKNGLHLETDSRKFLREMREIMEGQQFLSQMREQRTLGDIFISYASEDVKIAMKLFYILKDKNFNVWIDYYGLQPNDRYTREIENAIKGCDIFIPILSSQMKHDIEAKNERYYMKEWDMALANGRTIAPITVGDYSPRGEYHSSGFCKRCGLIEDEDITICSWKDIDRFVSVIENLLSQEKH